MSDLECTVCASGVTSPHGVPATPGQAARDLPAEGTAREFAGWAEAQGYPGDTGDRPEYAIGDMAEAFAAGMQAARDLAAPEPHAAGELAAVLAESRRYRNALGQVARHSDDDIAQVRIVAKIARRALEGK